MDQAEGAIYPPPKEGLPFLVVTFANGNIRTQATASRSEARMLLARERTRKMHDGIQVELQAVSSKV